MNNKIKILLILFLLIIFLTNIFFSQNGLANMGQKIQPQSIGIISKSNDCYVSNGVIPLGPTYNVTNLCDNNVTSQTLYSGSNFPHYFVVNLTKRFLVDHLAINWGNYPFNGHIDVWTGSSFIAYSNFTNSGTGTNQTITLNSQYVTQKIRLWASTDKNGNIPDNYFGAYEVWFYGDLPPKDFSINSSQTTLSLVLNTDNQVIISVSGKENFTGKVNLTISLSNSHASAICSPIVLVINITSSYCTISADAPGHYTITFIGTNTTINKTHSINLTLIVTVKDYTPIWFTIILLIFAFIVLFVVGFFERFAMVGAGLVSAIIAVLSWSWTGEIFIPAVFTLMLAVCIGLAMTKKK